MGGSNPIRIQSMTNTATQDTEASVAQAKRIVDAGGEYVRLTAQGIKEAENLMNINIGLRQDGYMVPLVADIHFNPKVADVAAQYVEKVRINPGNYVDAARTFKHLEYTDEEYAQELQKIHDRFVPFLNICKENHTAIRIGVNHGSLSDRIMSRYGDTPEGMVESCMEFLRICVQENFTDVVISIKASNTKDGGISTFRSSVVVKPQAKQSKSAVSCQSLMLDDISRSDTIPAMDIRTKDADVGHEARIGRISDEAVFYLMSRGISEEEARAMIVSGFADNVSKELPLEYAVEMNNLIRLEMKGSIG